MQRATETREKRQSVIIEEEGGMMAVRGVMKTQMKRVSFTEIFLWDLSCSGCDAFTTAVVQKDHEYIKVNFNFIHL